MLEGGKRLRIYYLAQVDVQPPRFVLFVNNIKLMSDTYKKYLINQFRETYGFLGAPIQFFLKGRSADKAKAEISPTLSSSVQNSSKTGGLKLTVPSQVYYRITVRVQGSRNAVSYSQAVVAI